MPILVTTGGPIGNLSLPEAGQFLTYADMVNQISDELDDANDSYLAQIQNAVLAAIRFCAGEPFYFNRNREVILSTRAGCACYDAKDNAALAQLGSISAVYGEANGQIFALRREAADKFPLLAGGGAMAGLPCLYGLFGTEFRLYPIPDKSYIIRILLNPAVLPDIHAADEENPWFTHAFDLIKARAKYDIYKDILKDAPLAAAAFRDFQEQWTRLLAETSRRAGVESLRPTRF